jgi:hypothetical protein
MAWPSLAELKQALGVTSDDSDSLLERALAAAIMQVKKDVSGSVADFEMEDFPLGPTPDLEQAALILAVMATKAPDAPYGVAAVFDVGGMRVAAEHPTYLSMLAGSRHDFGLR